ncbi:glycoside hydrolase family 27 protein [Dyella monticola]|nr:glycoside hydrolase family 27 protein [Dyella monticola]
MSKRSKAAVWWLCVIGALVWPWLATAASIDNASLARTPPMGWNSWNHFGAAVTDADIRHAADAMVSSGMAAAGYRYIIIDDGWQGERDAHGVLHPNAKFPDMKALVDYVHSKGLKFGIYSSPGPKTCAGYTGSYGHEAQDATLYASWGVDYLKYDLCSFTDSLKGKPEAEQVAMMKAAYLKMHEALKATGRPIVYALCSYGWGRVWAWGKDVGANLWRTTDDIEANYVSMMFNASAQQGLQRFAGPGHWNDADMLEIGNKGMDTQAMERTHMSLWALLAAPLIAGNDLFTMDAVTREVLINKEVITINQDPRGIAGNRVFQEGPIQIWSRPLADGSIAVGLINTLNHSLNASLDFNALGLKGAVAARDVWEHKDLGRIDAKQVFDVPAYGVVLLKLRAH